MKIPAFVAVPVALLSLGAALPPSLQGSGLWEVGTKASGAGAGRHCLADTALLTQWEHRGAQCTRVVLSGNRDRSEVQYTCPAGGFGTSRVQLLTPRSVRIETQGISGGLPFGYTIYARRLGPCGPVKR
ncbi:DUF3617 domain-containing protein [Sphingomonas mesophila]|uniref:DUF3617 domain-containing protein n=1 Tax=Sphingomonas mesophila TaxID=2303576 RepID=UPI000E5873FB|nr:DUF3617 family protein [Sphingomonas mesophila]